jgi:hypothetical protein
LALTVSTAWVLQAAETVGMFHPVNKLGCHLNLVVNFIRINWIVLKFSQTYIKKFVKLLGFQLVIFSPDLVVVELLQFWDFA